jgi:hypothetical protein
LPAAGALDCVSGSGRTRAFTWLSYSEPSEQSGLKAESARRPSGRPMRTRNMRVTSEQNGFGGTRRGIERIALAQKRAGAAIGGRKCLDEENGNN